MKRPTFDPAELEALAARFGTPYYLYDLDLLRARIVRFRQAFRAIPHRLLYAAKANPNPALLAAIRADVDGLDIASLGELARGLAAGYPSSSLSLAGPGKADRLLREAVAAGASISVESLRELEAVAALARARGAKCPVRLRLNPKQRVHAYRAGMIGLASPFGIDEEALEAAADRVKVNLDALDLEGLHVHPGGQCTSAGGFGAALETTLALARRLEDEFDLPSRSIDLGGGFGVLAEQELDVEAAGRRAKAAFEQFSHRAERPPPILVLELGRWLVADAGLYVARVVSEKSSRGTDFTILDGGLNHHLAATGHLYGPGAGRLPIVNLSAPDRPVAVRTVVGPLCTPLDVLGTEVTLAAPRVGDLLGILGSGAYGFSLSPLLFLGHPPPAELVREGGVVRDASTLPR